MTTTKQPPKGKHYKVVLFYPRSHQPTFHTKLAAERYLEGRALTKSAQCYVELWEMQDENNGEQLSLFDYGSTKPQKLVREE